MASLNLTDDNSRQCKAICKFRKKIKLVPEIGLRWNIMFILTNKLALPDVFFWLNLK